MLILLHIDYSLHMAMACLSSCPETMACKAENIYRHALFYCAPLYCISHVWFFCFVLFFLQIEVVWQYCIEQVSWYHFSSSIYSLGFHILVILATFLTLSNKLYLLWSVIRDLWCYHWKRITVLTEASDVD